MFVKADVTPQLLMMVNSGLKLPESPNTIENGHRYQPTGAFKYKYLKHSQTMA